MTNINTENNITQIEVIQPDSQQISVEKIYTQVIEVNTSGPQGKLGTSGTSGLGGTAGTTGTSGIDGVANIIFGTGSPPDPGTVDEGTIFIQYIA